MFNIVRSQAAAHGRIRARLYGGGMLGPQQTDSSSPSSRKAKVVEKSPKLTPAKRARRPSEDVIAKRYIDLQKLREDVRRAISFGVHMHTHRAPRGLSSARIEIERQSSTGRIRYAFGRSVCSKINPQRRYQA
jgi:hypothetical protein